MPIGIAAAIGTAIDAAGAFIAAGVAELGVGAATAATIGSGIAYGGAIGAVGGGLLSGIEGRPILTGIGEGALGGAITGGFVGAGGALGAEAGIGSGAGDVLGGAAGGALGAEVTGGNPLVGAAGGAVSGGIAASGLSPGSGSDAPAGTAPASGTGVAGTATGGPGVGAVGASAPAGVDPGAVGADAATPAAASTTMGTALGANPTVADNPTPMSGGMPGATPDPTAGPVPSGTPLAPQDAATVQQSMASAAAGGNSNAALSTAATTTTDPNTPNVVTYPNLGTPSTGTPTPDPELNGATGFQPGGGMAAPPTPAATTAGTTNWGDFSNDPTGTVGSALKNNASWLVPAAGLGMTAAKTLFAGGPSISGTESTLQNQANTLNANSAQMESYLQTGQLPAGVAQSITSATASAKASIRSQYAARGMAGSSAEAQDLAAVDNQASSQGANIAMGLMQQGISEAQLAQGIYGQLLNASVAQNAQLSSAIGSFASSLVPKSTTNLTVTQAA